jgi:DNA-binding NarL/FixJ family response regulator
MGPQSATTPAEEFIVASIRTVVITMAPIFRDLIAELVTRHTRLNVVAELDGRQGLEERLRPLAPDLILIGLARNEGDEIGLSLVRLLPNTKVIAFSSDGRHAFVHQMQPQRTVLLDVSPQALIEAILRL